MKPHWAGMIAFHWGGRYIHFASGLLTQWGAVMLRKCGLQFGIRRVESIGVLLLSVFGAVLGVAEPARATWNTVTGIKDGPETVAEPANPWDGERLLVFGGTLNFAGSVDLDGELWMQQMSGWPNPIVNIPGTLTMQSPSSQFRVVGGADLNIGNAAASSVEAGEVLINGGSQVTIGDLTAHDGLLLQSSNGQLHVLGDYFQVGGDFRVADGANNLTVDGTFTKTGNGYFHVHNSDLILANPATSSVEAGLVWIIAKSVSLGDVTSHDGLLVEGTNGQLHVLDDYTQDGGDFRVAAGGGNLTVDGTFTKTGNGYFHVHNSDLILANPATSPVEAGLVWIIAKSVSLGDVTSHDGLLVEGTNGQLHVLDDYTQDGGDFRVAAGGGNLTVDGTFTKTGNGYFHVHNSDLILANPATTPLKRGLCGSLARASL